MNHHSKVWTWDGKATDVTIRLLDDEDRAEVTISRGTHFGDLGRAMINWPGCGAQDAGVTAAFIRELAVAHRIAGMLDALSPDEFAAIDEVDADRMVAAALAGDETW